MSGESDRTSRVRYVLKTAFRATRSLPDRLLHRHRHRAIQRRLSSTRCPRKMLVVCHGNVCRSPYLQAVLQRALPDVAVDSAGFMGSDRPVPPVSVALCAQRGLDLSGYRSRPLTHASVASADLVIVMDSGQGRQIERLFPHNRAPVVVAGDLDPRFEACRAIPDPWSLSSDVFESSFNRLDRCAATLVTILKRSS